MRYGQKIPIVVALGFLQVTAFTHQTSFAQNAEQGQRLLEQREIEQKEDRARRGNQNIQVQTEGAATEQKEQKCFPIKTIDVSGYKIVPASEINAVVKKGRRACMTQNQIIELLQTLSKLYIDKGHITSRALTPEQDISTGTLKIVIVEGFVEEISHKVQTKNGSRPGSKRKIQMAFPGMAGEVLQLRDLEQGLDQINRLPSNTAKVDIKPGKKIGGSVLEINNTIDDQIRGLVRTYYSDYGDVGHEARADLVFEADDLFNLNDTWFLAYSGGNLFNSFSMSASLPYGYWLLSLSGSYSESVSQLTATSDLFNQASSITASADRVLFRNSDSKLRGQGSYTYRWSERHINSLQLTPQTLSIIGTQLSYEKYLPGAYASISGGVDIGVPAFGVPESVNAQGVPQTEFIKPTLDATYYTGWKNGVTLFSRFHGQYSSDVLLNTEQLFIGGPETIRGYETGSVAGEHGAYIQNTLTAPIHLAFGGKENFEKRTGSLSRYLNGLSTYAFVDAGAVHSVANKENSYMIGVGGGLKYTSKYISTDLYAAVPLYRANEIAPPDFEIRLSTTFKVF